MARKAICFIPARGGSNGIVGKNTLSVGGLPLVAWSIMQARYLAKHTALKWFDDVKTVLSTDSQDILREALRFDFDFQYADRPKHLAENGASLEDVVYDFIDRVEKPSPEDEVFIILMQPTSPIRRKATLDKFAEMLPGFDSVVTIRESNPHTFTGGNFYREFTERYPRQVRPQEERLYHDAGNLYGFTLKTLCEERDRIGGRVGHLEVGLYEALELDEIDELPLIEEAMRVLGMKGGHF